MKCSGSPTTCTAADTARATLVATVVDAVLFREILKPIAAGLGPVGETAVAQVADRLARAPR
jgi:hypothetical protein